jgi:protein-S-isoprenylcysteine O-methyltransferase Ste14
MNRTLVLLHGAVAYILFLAVFLYLVGFVANLGVPRGIDDGAPGPLAASLLVNAALMAAFGVQHSVMARPWFKRAWTAFIPEPAERSTFVLLASALLALLMWAWQPLPTLLWDVRDGALGDLLLATSALGWALVLLSTFAIDHFHLFGLRQTLHHWLGRPPLEPQFRVAGPYKLVRHPLMLGFLVAFWATPAMSVGHLEFALGMTVYILIALVHEERDLRAAHGAHYDGYAARTPRLNPFARR